LNAAKNLKIYVQFGKKSTIFRRRQLLEATLGDFILTNWQLTQLVPEQEQEFWGALAIKNK